MSVLAEYGGAFQIVASQHSNRPDLQSGWSRKAFVMPALATILRYKRTSHHIPISNRDDTGSLVISRQQLPRAES